MPAILFFSTKKDKYVRYFMITDDYNYMYKPASHTNLLKSNQLCTYDMLTIICSVICLHSTNHNTHYYSGNMYCFFQKHYKPKLQFEPSKIVLVRK